MLNAFGITTSRSMGYGTYNVEEEEEAG